MSRSRIDVVAPPFLGHLIPILGVADALREFGSVRVLTTPDAAPTVAACGFECVPILAGKVAEVWRIADPSAPVRGRPWRLWHQWRANLRLMPQLRAEIASIWSARPPGLAVVDFTLPVVGHLAVAQGIRWWTSHPSPLAIETPDGTPSYLGGWRPPCSQLGRGRDWLGRCCIRGFKRSVFLASARPLRGLGLPGAYREDGSEQAYSAEAILALGVPELEFGRTWPRAVRFVGPAYGVRPVRNADPIELDPTRANVLVTVGTHLSHVRRDLASRVQAWAAKLPGVFLHYTAAGRAGGERMAGKNWRLYPYLDYRAALPGCAAVVHHGGAGATYQTLQAGLPSVVWPQDYDQFDFAARLDHRGLATWCRRSAGVPGALRRVLDDRGMQRRTARFAQVLAATDLKANLRQVVQEQQLPVETGRIAGTGHGQRIVT